MTENKLIQGLVCTKATETIPEIMYEKKPPVISICFHCNQEKEMKGLRGISGILCKRCWSNYTAFYNRNAYPPIHLARRKSDWLKRRMKILHRRTLLL